MPRSRKGVCQAFGTDVARYLDVSKCSSSSSATTEEPLGGLFSNYKLCWIACGAKLVVVNVGNCSIRSMWTFERARNDNDAIIICATELPVSNYPCSLLLVGLQTSIGSQISVYNPFTRCILRTFKFNSKITTIAVIDDGESVNPLPNILNEMEGVLAVGCDDGSVMLLDLCRNSMNSVLSGDYSCLADDTKPCNLCFIDCLVDTASTVKAKMEYCAASGDSLALPLNIGERGLFVPYSMNPSSVTSMRYCREAACLLVGYSTGSWQLWNLTSFDLLYTSPRATGLNTLVFDFRVLEPCDDPRHTLYIWVTHQPSPTGDGVPSPSSAESAFRVASNRHQFQINGHHPFVAMYTVLFDSKNPVKDYGFYYQNFLECTQSFRMDLSLNSDNEVNAKVISSSAISKQLTRNVINSTDPPESDSSALRLFTNVWEAWNEDTERIETLVSVFDLNQWYKEEMPNDAALMSRDECSAFLSCSALRRANALNVALIPDTFLMYTSVHPIEQHFYPSALSFDCVLIDEDGLVKFRLNGTQRQMLKDLTNYGGMALLRPNSIFSAVVNSSIVPVYADPLDADHAEVVDQRNYILTVCMENNLSSVVLECADLWYNGSHSVAGCTLTYLLNFLWDMFSTYKNNFGKISEPLFDQSGIEFDTNSKSRLQHCRTILYSIESVYSKIVAKYSNFIMADNVEQRSEAMKLILFYYENITWFMNMGLLPEQSWKAEPSSTIPYNFNKLFTFCSKRRDHLKSLPPVLYGDSHKGPLFLIDAVLEERAPRALDQWAAECGHSGGRVYPPSSLQSLLRTTLIAELPTKVKHSIITYFLLDFVDVIDNKQYRSAIDNILNYRYSFGIPEGQSRVVQAFWHLDHSYFEDGVQCLLDPSVAGNDLQEWEHRTVLRALVAQSKQRLALKYLHFKRPALNLPDDIRLEMSLLLSNNLINQAFMFQRHHEPLRASLLKQFFTGCLNNRNVKAIYSLPLDTYEEEVFMNFLKNSNLKKSGSLQVLYLVTRAKYLEAIELNDKLNSYGRRASGSSSTANTSLAIFGPKKHPQSGLLPSSSSSSPFSMKPDESMGSTCHATDLLVKGIARTITSVSRQMAAVSSSPLLPNTINRLTGKRLQPLSVTLRTTEEDGGISNFKNSEGDVIASALAHTHHLWKHLLETPQPLKNRATIVDREEAEESTGLSRKAKRRPEEDRTLDGSEEEEVEEELSRVRKHARFSPSLMVGAEVRLETPRQMANRRRADDRDAHYEEVERLVSTPLVKRWGHISSVTTTPATASQAKPASILKLSQKRIGLESATATARSTPVLRSARKKARGTTPLSGTQQTPSKMIRFKLPSGSPELATAASDSAPAEEEPSSVHQPVVKEEEPVEESSSRPDVEPPTHTFKVSARKSLRTLREGSSNRSRPSSSAAEVTSTGDTPQPQLESYRDRLRTRSATKSPGGALGTPRRKTPDVKVKKTKEEEPAEEEEDWRVEAENLANGVLFKYESVSSSVKKSTRRTTSNKSLPSATSGIVPRVLFKKGDKEEVDECNTTVTKTTVTTEESSVVETLISKSNGNEEPVSVVMEEVEKICGEETVDWDEPGASDNARIENHERRSFVEEIMMARDGDEKEDIVEEKDEHKAEEEEEEIKAKKGREESEEVGQLENLDTAEEDERVEDGGKKVEEDLAFDKEEDKYDENEIEMIEENKVEKIEEREEWEKDKVEEMEEEEWEDNEEERIDEEEREAEKTEEQNEVGKEEDKKPEENTAEKSEENHPGKVGLLEEHVEPETKAGKEEKEDVGEDVVEMEAVAGRQEGADGQEAVEFEDGDDEEEEVEEIEEEEEEEEEEEREGEDEDEEQQEGSDGPYASDNEHMDPRDMEDEEEIEAKTREVEALIRKRGYSMDPGPFSEGGHCWGGTSSAVKWIMEKAARELSPELRPASGPSNSDNDVVALDIDQEDIDQEDIDVQPLYAKHKDFLLSELDKLNRQDELDEDIYAGLDDDILAEGKPSILDEKDDDDEEEQEQEQEMVEDEEEEESTQESEEEDEDDGSVICLDSEDDEQEEKDHSDKDEITSQRDEEEQEQEVLTKEEIRAESVHGSNSSDATQSGAVADDATLDVNAMIGYSSEMGVKIVDTEEYLHNSSLEVEQEPEKRVENQQEEETHERVAQEEEAREEEIQPDRQSELLRQEIVIKEVFSIDDESGLEEISCTGIVELADVSSCVDNDPAEEEMEPDKGKDGEVMDAVEHNVPTVEDDIGAETVGTEVPDEERASQNMEEEKEGDVIEAIQDNILTVKDDAGAETVRTKDPDEETAGQNMVEGKEGEVMDIVEDIVPTVENAISTEELADNKASPASFDDSQDVNVADMAMVYSEDDSRETVEFSLTHGNISMLADSPRGEAGNKTPMSEKVLRMKERPLLVVAEKEETTTMKGKRRGVAMTPKKAEASTPRRTRRKPETPETTPRRGRSSKSIQDDELEEILKIGNTQKKKSTVDRSMMTERKFDKEKEEETKEKVEELKKKKEEEEMKEKKDEDMKLTLDLEEEETEVGQPTDRRQQRSSSLQPGESTRAAVPTILKKKKSVSISDLREIIPDPEEERRAMTRRRRSVAEQRLGVDAPPSSSEDEPEEDKADRRKRRSVEAAARLRRKTLEAEARRRILNILEEEEPRRKSDDYGIVKQKKSVSTSDLRRTSDLPEGEDRGHARSSTDYGIVKQRKSFSTSNLRNAVQRTSALPEREDLDHARSSTDYGIVKQRKSVSTSNLRDVVRRTSTLPEGEDRNPARSSVNDGIAKQRKSVSASDLREVPTRTFNLPEGQYRDRTRSSTDYGNMKQRKSVSISDLREVIPEDRYLGKWYSEEEEYGNRFSSRESSRRYSSDVRPIEEIQEGSRKEVFRRRSTEVVAEVDNKRSSSSLSHQRLPAIVEDQETANKKMSRRHSSRQIELFRPIEPASGKLEEPGPDGESHKMSRRHSTREEELFRSIEPPSEPGTRKRRGGSLSGFPVGNSSSAGDVTTTKRRSLKRRLIMLDDIAEETTSLCELDLDVTDMDAELAIAKQPSAPIPEASKSNRLDINRENMIKKWIGDQELRWEAERRKNQKKRQVPKFKMVVESSDDESLDGRRGLAAVVQQDKEVEDLVRGSAKPKGSHHHLQQQHHLLEEDTMSIASSETSMGKLLRSGRMVEDTPTPPKKKRSSRASITTGPQQDEKKPTRATNRAANSPTPSPTSSLLKHNLMPLRAKDGEQNNSEQSEDEVNNISISSRTRSSTRQKQKKKV